MIASWVMLALASSSQPAVESKPISDPDKVVCKRLNQTGSRLASTKVCMTRAQWADRQRQDQKEIEKMQANMGRCPTGQAC